MPRWRPGHACGPAPNGSQAPGRCVPLLPSARVEPGQTVGVARDQLGQPAEEEGADQHDRARRHRSTAEIDLDAWSCGR